MRMFFTIKKFRRQLSVFMIVLLNIQVVAATQNAQEARNVFADIKNLYSKTLKVIQVEEAEVDKKNLKLTVDLPTEDMMQLYVLNSLSNMPQIHRYNNRYTTSLDHAFLDKMELFSGSDNYQSNLLKVIDRTSTIFGRMMLAGQLATPFYDIQILSKKQNIIKALLENTKLFDEIQEQLDIIKAVQPYFVSYFQKEHPANEECFKKLYWGTRFDFLNSNEWALELGVRLGNLGNLFAVTAIPLQLASISGSIRHTKAVIDQKPISYLRAVGLGVKGLVSPSLEAYKDGGFEGRKKDVLTAFELIQTKAAEIDQLNYNLTHFNMSDSERELVLQQRKVLISSFNDASKGCATSMFNVIPLTFGDGAHLVNNIQGVPKYTALGVVGLLTALQGYLAYSAFQDTKFKQSIANYLQTRLIAVAAYINAIKKLHSIVENNPVLAVSPGYEALGYFTRKPHERTYAELSADCRKLLELLDHNTFNGNASVFSLTGRVLAAHKLMQKVKDELIPACAAAGAIDAYLSIAKLYRAFEHGPVHFCFAEYAVAAGQPFVQAEKFWNPFVDPKIVVTSDVALGNNIIPNNMILTGPNTGGKSTVIKGLIINILLAQTFGIASSDRLILTPFANLNCYLNITDDLTAGTSLFKAEVLRAKALLESIRNLEPNQVSFTIIDEVFSGTSPKEGEEAALQFAQQLGGIRQNMCCIATHFPRMPVEVSSEQFKNFKVTVYKDANGNWVRPFKLENGISDLNIAMDLLREEGIFE